MRRLLFVAMIAPTVAGISLTPADILVDGRVCGMSVGNEHGGAEAVSLTEQNFDEVLAATQGLVMVDFWAEWCGPCRAIAPVLEELAEASNSRVTLLKVNVDENPGLAARYGIRSIPTILFVKNGAVVDRVVGAAPKAMLQNVVNARA
jgi:thioredoxin 1